MKKMKNFGKRSLSLLLCLIMIVGMLQITAFAEDGGEIDTNTNTSEDVVIDVSPDKDDGDDDADTDADDDDVKDPEPSEKPNDINSVESENRPHVSVDPTDEKNVTYEGEDDKGLGITLKGEEISKPNENNPTTATPENPNTQATGTITGSETAGGNASYGEGENQIDDLIVVEPGDNEIPNPVEKPDQEITGTVNVKDNATTDPETIKVTLENGKGEDSSAQFGLTEEAITAAKDAALKALKEELASDTAAPEGYTPNEKGVYTKTEGNLAEDGKETTSTWSKTVSDVSSNGEITVTEVTMTTEIETTEAPIDWEAPEGAIVNPDGDGYSVTTYNPDGSWVVANTTFSNGVMTVTKLTILAVDTVYTVEAEGITNGSVGVSGVGVTAGKGDGTVGEWTEIQPDFDHFGFTTDANGSLLQDGKVVNGVSIGWTTSSEVRKFGAAGENITASSADAFKWVKEHGYGLSSVISTTSSRGGNAHQFAVYDNEGNVYYLYCADASVTPTSTQYGNKILLDGKTSVYPGLNTIQANYIAANGYWGASNDGTISGYAASAGSLDAYKQWLKDIGYSGNLDDVTDGVALAVTQGTLWYYAHSNDSFNDRVFTEFAYSGGTGSANTDGAKTAQAIYNYLLSADGQKKIAEVGTKLAEKDTVTVNSVKDVSVTVQSSTTEDDKTTNTANISFKLDVQPSKLNDDLLVVVKDAQGNAIKSYRLKDAAANEGTLTRRDTTYTISGIVLPNGENVTLHLEGTQINDKRSYVIVANGGYDKSQTFIGAEEQNRTYSLDISLNLKVEEAKATLVTSADVSAEKFQQLTKEWGSDWTIDYSYGSRPPEPTPGDDDDDDSDVEIPDDPTPLDPGPGPEDDVEINDEDVPLSEIPDDEVEILDEDVPLAEVPATGDISIAWYAAVVLSAAGLVCLTVLKKRDED